MDRTYCLCEDLATAFEEFIDTCTNEGFVPPHPADVARMEKCGVQLKHTPVSVAAANHVAEKVAKKLPEEATIVKEEASQEVSSQKRRKRKHHHSQEHREE